MSIKWHSHLLDKVAVHSHLFWHSTDATMAVNGASSLRQSSSNELSLVTLDCLELPITSTGELDIHAVETIECDIFVILNFDALLELRRGHLWMRQLRPAVLNLLRKRTRLVVASRKPQSEFPAIDGSSLATDCVQYTPGQLEPRALETNLSSEQIDELTKLSAGLIGPASRILEAHPDMVGITEAEAANILKRSLVTSMMQCGPEVVSWLDREILVGKKRSLNFEAVSPKIVSILQGAGLGKANILTDRFELLPALDIEMLCDLIETAERSYVSAPIQWRDAAAALFTFERSARKALIDFAGTDSNLTSLLSHLSDKIRNNFKTEYGIAAPPLINIPNPVRLIDLSDLLEILTNAAGSSRICGLSSAQWKKAKVDILPLRNKLQHMRLPSVGDRETIESYTRRLSDHLI